MLRSLHIKNYILIDSLDIDFPEGLIIITGQTGAGKSTVRDIFKEKGAAVIDADSVAHDITDNNLDCIYDIVSRFSCLVLNESLVMIGMANFQYVPTTLFVDSNGDLVGTEIVGALDETGWQDTISQRLEMVK